MTELLSAADSPGAKSFLPKRNAARKPRVGDRVLIVPAPLWGIPLPPTQTVIVAIVTAVDAMTGEATDLFLLPPRLAPVGVTGVPHDEEKKPGTWHHFPGEFPS